MIGLFLRERVANSIAHPPSWRKSFWRTHFNRHRTNSQRLNVSYFPIQTIKNS
jgi:hypothetical protein